jgi:hypothetical protein
MAPTEAELPPADAAERVSRRPTWPDLLLFLATMLFGLSVRQGTLSGVAVVAATAALIACVHLIRRGAAPDPDPTVLDERLLAGVALFGLMGVIGWAPSFVGPTTVALERAPGCTFAVLALAAFVTRRSQSRGRHVALLAGTLIATAVFGIAHISSARGIGFDVLLLHEGAAEALLNGDNPYTDAVTVPDGSPNAEPGDVITGYVYPPITALFYALGHWLTPDARYVGLVAWLIVIVVVGWVGAKRRSNRSLYTAMLLAAVPGLWLVLRAAWTEPLSLAFLSAGLSCWAFRAASGLGVGAMLASKQYFVVTAPVLLLHRDQGWLRRLMFAGLALLMTIGPFLIWDAAAFWESAIVFHTQTAPRFDGANVIGLLSLAGLEWAPPVWVPLGLGLMAGAWAGRDSTTRRRFVLAMAAALAASFLVSSQAFANYWFLVFGMCVFALWDSDREDATEHVP